MSVLYTVASLCQERRLRKPGASRTRRNIRRGGIVTKRWSSGRVISHVARVMSEPERRGQSAEAERSFQFYHNCAPITSRVISRCKAKMQRDDGGAWCWD